MPWHHFCSLLGSSLTPPQPAWAASGSSTKPTDAHIINSTATGRFRLEMSRVSIEFKLTRLGDWPGGATCIGLAGILAAAHPGGAQSRKSVRERRSA
jgi:hypothetical protein